jgi:hypothetical protein
VSLGGSLLSEETNLVFLVDIISSQSGLKGDKYVGKERVGMSNVLKELSDLKL